MPRRIEGEVVRLQCRSCASIFHAFTFSGDTDMVTGDLAFATRVDSAELALAEAPSADRLDEDDGAREALEARIADALGRPGFRAPRLLRFEEPPPPPDPAQWQHYRAAKVVYQCIACPTGEAVEITRLSVRAFVRSSGRINLLGDLVLDQAGG
ncbi:hypothetical protein [Caulobacter mirabilis]|uniref:Uncharacterized protein n=1 Tax=Caulobacter mirabilis TaxID=69666 RepID=A0A2D2AU58_9CAUL|nr:hypothetical protein [Caulobacter mirabilis]ATQ41539.1 hypothetical protein CSW64_03480 [Caulobacter mirabilis]